jgi:hypothetical protein
MLPKRAATPMMIVMAPSSASSSTIAIGAT